MKGGKDTRGRCCSDRWWWMDECEIINRRKTKLTHAGGGSTTAGLNGGGEVIKVEEFMGDAWDVESETRDLLKTSTGIVEV